MVNDNKKYICSECKEKFNPNFGIVIYKYAGKTKRIFCSLTCVSRNYINIINKPQWKNKK